MVVASPVARLASQASFSTIVPPSDVLVLGGSLESEVGFGLGFGSPEDLRLWNIQKTKYQNGID